MGSWYRSRCYHGAALSCSETHSSGNKSCVMELRVASKGKHSPSVCPFPAKGPLSEAVFAAGMPKTAPNPGVLVALLAEARPSAASGSEVGTRSQPALSQLGTAVPPLPPPLHSIRPMRMAAVEIGR